MLLALDTSTHTIGLALTDGNQILAETLWQGPLRHTQTLAPAAEKLLQQAGIAWEQINAVGIATGPGSFTSLRVGMAFAKGLHLARGLALIGIPTLDALAAIQPPDQRPLLAVLQAGRGRLALVEYRHDGSRWHAERTPRVTRLAELLASVDAPAILCGELTAEERAQAAAHPLVEVPGAARCTRFPAVLAEIAWERWQSGQQDDPATLAPIYLHVAGAPKL